MTDLLNNAKMAYANHVAKIHMDVSKNLQSVYWVDGDENKASSIILLLVERHKEETGLNPVSFAACDDSPWSMILIEVSETEFSLIQKGSIEMPVGWTLGQCIIRKDQAKSLKRNDVIQAIMERRRKPKCHS